MHFKRLPGWVQIVCLLALAIVVTWGFWMALRDTLCAVETKDWILKRPTRGACLEFWLFRYQGLIGGMLALFGAAVTVRAMMVQTRFTRETNENVGRVFAYSVIRDFLHVAFDEMDHVINFYANPYDPYAAEFNGKFPVLPLEGDIHPLGFLPPKLAKDLFDLRISTAGVASNVEAFRSDNIGPLHFYFRGALAGNIIRADELSRAIAGPLGIYKESFHLSTEVSLRRWATDYEKNAGTVEQTIAWLNDEYARLTRPSRFETSVTED